MLREKRSNQAIKEVNRIEQIINDVRDLSGILISIKHTAEGEWEGKASLAFQETLMTLNKDLNNLRIELSELKNKVNVLKDEFLIEEEKEKEIFNDMLM